MFAPLCLSLPASASSSSSLASVSHPLASIQETSIHRLTLPFSHIGSGATEAQLLNQNLLPKPHQFPVM